MATLDATTPNAETIEYTLVHETCKNLIYTSGKNFENTTIGYQFADSDDELSIHAHSWKGFESPSIDRPLTRLHFEWSCNTGAEFHLWVKTEHLESFFVGGFCANRDWQTDLYLNTWFGDNLSVMIFSNASLRRHETSKNLPALHPIKKVQINPIQPDRPKILVCSMKRDGAIKLRRATSLQPFSVVRIFWTVASHLTFKVWAKISGTWSVIHYFCTNDALEIDTIINVPSSQVLKIKLEPISEGFTGWLYK